MTPTDMLFLLRRQIADEQNVGWANDAELSAYLDRAADYLSGKLIAAKDPTMLARFRVDGGPTPTPLPDDFVSFAGLAPVAVTGKNCESYFGGMSFGVNYWAKLPLFTSLPSERQTPYGGEKELMIVDIARIFALNRNEYDITQDMALLKETSGSLGEARTGAAARE